MQKVFGIGFQKTGTSSLMRALQTLGYRVCDGCGNADNPNIENEVYEICYSLVEKYDAFEDHPWSVLYRELDEKYPNSKFILTVRPTEQWIRSMCSHFGSQYTPMREWIYGVGHPQGNEEVYIERYERHNAEVKEYFKDRSNDLLILQMDGKTEEQQLWKSICDFLGKPLPENVKFPHANSKKDRLVINHLRRVKHKLYGKEPIEFLGVKIGKNFSQ